MRGIGFAVPFGTSILSLTLACGPAQRLEPGPASIQFPLGVASGEAQETSALLWTSHTSDSPVSVAIWRAGEEDGPPLQTTHCSVDSENIVHHLVNGLEPSTRYSYQFIETTNGVETARSELGHFKTRLRADSLAPVRFGAVSCIHQRFPQDPLLRAAERDDLDAFLLLGDTLYADGSKTTDDFRDVWRTALGRHPHRRLRASTSLIPTWDDHEVVNNFKGRETSFEELTKLGKQQFFAFQPVQPQPQFPDRIWRTVRWGKTAEIFVLDCRGERAAERGEYISREQLDWLKQGLSSSSAAFKVILNSVPISEFPGPVFGLGLDDRWEGFPAQRTELLQFIDERKIPGVLWVSGDFHLGTVGRVSRTGPGSKAIETLVGPGGQQSNVSPTYPSKPQFDFSTGVNNFVVIDLEPATLNASLRYIAGDGRELSHLTYDLNVR